MISPRLAKGKDVSGRVTARQREEGTTMDGGGVWAASTSHDASNTETCGNADADKVAGRWRYAA